MESGYKIFSSQLDEATIEFSSLFKTISEGEEILKGSLDIIDKNGKHWETYEIEIHGTEHFPNRFPLLFETSGKIPKVSDWHINPDSSCCIKVEPEEILRCKKGITLAEYIREEVIPYLFNQTYRKAEGYYVNGEYSHGVNGIYQFYSKILNTFNDIPRTVRLINFIANNDRPLRTSSCFCGNKSKFRHCHREAFDKLKQIGDEKLQLHASMIAKAAGLL